MRKAAARAVGGPDSAALRAGDRLRAEGRLPEAVEAYRAAAAGMEAPPAAVCLRIARCLRALEDVPGTLHWAAAVTDAVDEFTAWHAAAAIIRDCTSVPAGSPLRAARLALLGSYTTAHFAPLLRLAALRRGILLEVRECAYGQYRQEILDPASTVFAALPDIVLLAVHAGEVALPDYSEQPGTDVDAEVRRWTSLWDAAARRSPARVIQHGFAIPPEDPHGHLSAGLPGTRPRMLQTLNHRLAEAARNRAAFVDCDRLAAHCGKRSWFDARYWHHAKEAVALGALPLLARHTAAVIAAELGLSRKCLVLDLDNTLWGGVIGEDGLAGIRLGDGVDGEAYCAFQEYLLRLKDRGIVLAVCSKNNDADAREPFEKHPDMRLRLEDITLFVSNWESKADNLRRIARTLNLGLDALVLVDDNPVERLAIRQLLPEVEVVPLPPDPAGYTRALSEFLHFETTVFTREDAQRTSQYQARARLMELESAAASLEDFHRSLAMQAVVKPFDEADLPRIAQLIGKTNQFNLTTRRHGVAQLRRFMQDPDCVHFSLRLRDRFADHGLVAVMIARRQERSLDIDTLLMSCRVIGRTVEAEMLQQLCERALALGCTSLRGTWIPTAKNALVRDLYARFGFEPTGANDGSTTWQYDIAAKGIIRNQFIATTAGEPLLQGSAPWM